MRRAAVAAVAVLASWLLAAPSAAISPSFFASYVSAGALVVQTSFPVEGSALISINFNPAEFSPTEANALYLALRALLSGAQVTSFAPGDLATAGLSPVQAILALQNFYLFGPSADFLEFWLLNVYRRQPSGIGIDVYRFFGPDNFQFTLTFQG
jgi:hypothetical protein